MYIRKQQIAKPFHKNYVIFLDFYVIFLVGKTSDLDYNKSVTKMWRYIMKISCCLSLLFLLGTFHYLDPQDYELY